MSISMNMNENRKIIVSEPDTTQEPNYTSIQSYYISQLKSNHLLEEIGRLIHTSRRTSTKPYMMKLLILEAAKRVGGHDA